MYQNDRIFKRLQIQPKFPSRSEDGIVGRRKSTCKGSEAGMNSATARHQKETTRLESSEGARGEGAAVARPEEPSLCSRSTTR